MVIDVCVLMDFVGVFFEFWDIVWEEKLFEIECRVLAVNGNFDFKFDIVVLIEGGLKGCVVKFSFIIYIDRDVLYMFYFEWLYCIMMKNLDLDDVNEITYLLFF